MLDKFSEVNFLYVHFPLCRHLCNYCDFHKSLVGPNKISAFHDYLKKSMDQHQNYLGSNGYRLNNLKTIYIGGGTPSLWGSEGISFLLDLLDEYNIRLSSDIEFTCELNPGSWKPNSINEMLDLGVNRFSVGVQSFDKRLIKNLDRIHSIGDVHHTLEIMSGMDINFSVDLMLGLPSLDGTVRNLEKEVEELLQYKPKHISSYILTVNKNYTHYVNLPKEKRIEHEYLDFSHLLRSHGYDHYEISNFSLNGFKSRHNLSYWNSSSVAALGPSATGYLSGDNTSLRYKWKTSGPSLTEEKIGVKEMSLEKLYLGLRTSSGTNLYNFVDRTKCEEELPELLENWDKSGFLVSNDPTCIILSSKGFLCSDTLIGQLFRWMHK